MRVVRRVATSVTGRAARAGRTAAGRPGAVGALACSSTVENARHPPQRPTHLAVSHPQAVQTYDVRVRPDRAAPLMSRTLGEGTDRVGDAAG